MTNCAAVEVRCWKTVLFTALEWMRITEYLKRLVRINVKSRETLTDNLFLFVFVCISHFQVSEPSTMLHQRRVQKAPNDMSTERRHKREDRQQRVTANRI